MPLDGEPIASDKITKAANSTLCFVQYTHYLLYKEPVVVRGHAESAEESDPALVDDLAVAVDGALRGDAQPARLAVEQRLLVVLSLEVKYVMSRYLIFFPIN